MRKGGDKENELMGGIILFKFLHFSLFSMVLDKMKKLGNILQKSRGYYIGLRQDSSC